MTNLQFKINDKVVYPSHGVGEIIDVESGSIAGIPVQVYVISFPHEKWC
jgi:CarD family transcriptional regulator